MAEENADLVRRQIRSPRSAAIAGIIFSLLITASLILMYPISSVDPADINREWLETQAGPATLAFQLVPFAGIAFLWFTGVIRERLGDKEDQFFATIFLGSGIIFVVMIFIWAATIAAIFGAYAVASDLLVDFDIFIYGISFMKVIIGSYVLRMAGVYMISVGTIWTRTGVAPRWLSIVTFVVALGFLFFAGSVRGFRFIFPGWVILVSIYVLIVNYQIEIGRRVRRQSPAK